jgi:hypothetical protein
MKLISCDLCDAVVKLTYELQFCECHNISGKYLSDGRIAYINLKDDDSFGSSRVLGVPNAIRYGKIREGTCWVFNWFEPYLLIYVAGKRQKIIDYDLGIPQFVDV